MNQRALPITAGIAGAALGLAAMGASVPALGLGAGACALVCALLASRSGPEAQTPTVDSEPTIDSSAANTSQITGDPVADQSLTVFQDSTTGLFNEAYFRVAVETRITAARRQLRPVAVVILEVRDGNGDDHQPADALAVAAVVRRTLRDADTACRLEDGRVAMVLEDTPEDGAIWAVERLRRALNATAATGKTQMRWAGIACYPAHAFDAKEALAKAERAFLLAREWKQDRIEVAAVD
ncbi:MAG: diguanylate cyclase [Acidimicrobiales bacterium]